MFRLVSLEISHTKIQSIQNNLTTQQYCLNFINGIMFSIMNIEARLVYKKLMITKLSNNKMSTFLDFRVF